MSSTSWHVLSTCSGCVQPKKKSCSSPRARARLARSRRWVVDVKDKYYELFHGQVSKGLEVA
jgi:hypothetical protein